MVRGGCYHWCTIWDTFKLNYRSHSQHVQYIAELWLGTVDWLCLFTCYNGSEDWNNVFLGHGNKSTCIEIWIWIKLNLMKSKEQRQKKETRIFKSEKCWANTSGLPMTTAEGQENCKCLDAQLQSPQAILFIIGRRWQMKSERKSMPVWKFNSLFTCIHTLLILMNRFLTLFSFRHMHDWEIVLILNIWQSNFVVLSRVLILSICLFLLTI